MRSVRTAERTARRAGPLSDVTLPAVLAWRTERRHYLDLVRRKREAFWATRVDVEQHQPCRLWRSFDQLLGRGRTPLADIDATVLHRFFDDKVAGVSAATAGAAEPQFTAVPSVARITYTVLVETLNPAQSINQYCCTSRL